MAARVATQSAIERFGGWSGLRRKAGVTSPAFSASGAAYPPTIPRERETEPDHPDPEDEIQVRLVPATTLIHKTAFGAAKVVEPAEPEDAVKSSTPPGAAKPAAHPSGRRPQRLQLGVQAAGHHQAAAGVPGPSATTPDLRDHWLRRDDRPEHIGRRFDIDVLRP